MARDGSTRSSSWRALSGDRRPRNVPSQPLESCAIARSHGDPSVQAAAVCACALLPNPRLRVLDLDATARPHDRHSGADPCGNAMANRSLRASRQQGLPLRQRVLPWRAPASASRSQRIRSCAHGHRRMGDRRKCRTRCERCQWGLTLATEIIIGSEDSQPAAEALGAMCRYHRIAEAIRPPTSASLTPARRLRSAEALVLGLR